MIILSIFIIGFVLPFMFSDNSYLLPICGVFIIVLIPIFYYKQIKILIKQMKKLKLMLILLVSVISFTSCSKVPAGNVGVKFYLLGGDKGVDSEELSPGRYWIGVNEELYIFPTFTQNYVWTADEEEGSENDESFNFQDVQGLELNADIGITYKINPTKVNTIFEKYKRGINEITDTYLRNMVRDALVKRTSTLDVEYIYGKGRAKLIEDVTLDVKELCDPIGIEIEKIYWIGRIKLPQTVKEAIDAKIKATQIAQQRENELREAEAKAKKTIAEADGRAKSILLEAEAQAQANRLLNASLTPTLVEYEKIQRWDGKLPQVTGSNALINLK
ncbi:MAG: SPFH domain-containing protein [Eubacteriaceae bacterium]